MGKSVAIRKREVNCRKYIEIRLRFPIQNSLSLNPLLEECPGKTRKMHIYC